MPSHLDRAQRQHPSINFPHRKRGRNGQPGAVDATCLENTAALLDAYGIGCRYNLMRHSLELTVPGFAPDPEREASATLSRVLELAERNGLRAKNLLDHLQILAVQYHPVADWIASRVWDGQDRVAALIATIALAPSADANLSGILIHRWLISCARSVLSDPNLPRFAPQGVLVFQGAQGIGKTQWLRSLAPTDNDWIMLGRTIDPHSRDSIQQATSVWICELGELDATTRKADVSALKAFVTGDVDVYRSAYDRREESRRRRTMMAGTVNPRTFLPDETGNRRWWTVATAGLDWQHGLDMQQVWAQLAVQVRQGAIWWLTPEEQRQLAESNRDHEITDPLVEDLWQTWKPAITVAGQTPPRSTLADIWQALPGRSGRPRTRAESNALATALRDKGCEHDTKLHGFPVYTVELIASASTATPRRYAGGE